MGFETTKNQQIKQNVDGAEYCNQSNSSSMYSKKRSTTGCITCKLRKKRCDEVKPICGDCVRLNRRCEYIEEGMQEEEAKRLMDEMTLLEKDSKTRKRKKKCDVVNTEEKLKQASLGLDNPDTPKRGIEKKKAKLSANSKYSSKTLDYRRRKSQSQPRRRSSSTSKVVFNPLLMSMGSINVSANQLPGLSQNGLIDPMSLPSLFTTEADNIQATPEHNVIDSTFTERETALMGDSSVTTAFNQGDVNGVGSQDVKAHMNGAQLPTSLSVLSTDIPKGKLDVPPTGETIACSTEQSIPLAQLNDPTVLRPELPPFDYDRLNTLSLSPGFTSFTSPNFQDVNQNIEGSAMPQSLNGEENCTSFTEIFSDGFSKLLQEHFKSENMQMDQTPLFSSNFQTSHEHDDNGPPAAKLDNNVHNNDTSTAVISSNTRSVVPIQLLSQIRQGKTSPKIYTNPSVYTNSTLANLTPVGKVLYDYYRDRLSFIASSAPRSENMYLNTFLSMAHVDRSVLYGIMAWSAFHLGGEALEKQGNYYIKLALERFCQKPLIEEENVNEAKFLCDVVNSDDEDIVKEPEFDEDFQNYEDLELSSLNRDNMINTRLAAFLILCGVEICRGDVSKWTRYLNYGAKLIKLKGGLERFNESKAEHFLVTNYAYHDITAIQVINERTIHFDVKDYEKMWSASNELQFTDPLHGISSPVFKILAEVNKLIITVQKLIRRSKKDDSEPKTNVSASPDEPKMYTLDEQDYLHAFGEDLASVTSSIDETFFNGIPSTVSDEWVGDDMDKEVILEDFDEIMMQCQTLEEMIHKARPKLSPNFTSEELEMHMTMFECFQLTGRIHLRQSVLRMNAASIEIQYLTKQLIRVLDVLLGTQVESCLCFPMFIAGMCAVTKKDRNEMNSRFRCFIKRYKWKNVLRCQIVIQYIWKLNANGEKFVDWYAVVKRLGWDLSFA